MPSSSDAAKRRRSERAIPGAPRQRWYCSVSLRWKRRPGGGVLRDRPPHVRARAHRDGAAALEALQQRDEPVVRDVPGRGDDDVAARVHRAVIAGDRAPADRRDHLGGADHGPPERVRAEDRLGEQVVHELLRRVLVHRDLLEHDLALLVELGERRREDHVGHHLERCVDVPVGDARVDDGVLARGRGVQLRAHRVEGLRDLLRVVGARALEEEVLDEVRDAGAIGALVARAGADPEAERHRADARHLLGDHALARVQLGEDVLLHRRSYPGGPCSFAP